MISILLSARNAVVPQSRKCHVIGIESHLGPDKLVSDPRPTIGAPLIDRVVWPLLSLEENCFRSLVILESRNSFYSSVFVALVRNLDVGVLNYFSSPSNFF